MDTLTLAFTAWLGFLTTLSVDTETVLNPGASDEQIQMLEEGIGMALPDELKQLYRLTNGQQALLRREPLEPGRYTAPLFGNWTFLSTEDALREYRVWQDVIRDGGLDSNEWITTREGHPVARVYWQEGWLPIAEDGGGNAYAVDLKPLRGGTYGQLIIMGPDEDERRVIAASFSEFFTEAVQHVVTHGCALEYGEEDNSDAHVPESARIKPWNNFTLFFNAEWQMPSLNYQCPEERVQYEPTRKDGYRKEASDKYRAWLADQEMDRAQSDRMNKLSALSLDTIVDEYHGVAAQTGLPVWFVPGGAIPQEYLEADDFPADQFPGGVIPLDFEMPGMQATYVNNMQFQLACNHGRPDDVLPYGSARIEDYQLFHEFLLQSGYWTDEQFQLANSAILDLPVVERSGDDDGSGVFVCSIVR